jgi:hypothetical protein
LRGLRPPRWLRGPVTRLRRASRRHLCLLLILRLHASPLTMLLMFLLLLWLTMRHEVQ